MSLARGTKINRGYATVTDDDGVNYRDIADTMCDLGYPMNHSSARNYIIKIMKTFVKTFCDRWDVEISENKILEIAKSPTFQKGVADLLMSVELDRRTKSE